MADSGHAKGWSLGRQVPGSNACHSVRDPWGSYAECPSDPEDFALNDEASLEPQPPTAGI